MKSFYTNVQIYGSSVLYRGIENGKQVRQKIEYLPTLYLASQSPAPFKTIHGEYLAELKPGTIREAREFVKKYDGVEGFTIYGNQRYEYAFISEVSDDIIDWDVSLLTIANIDIEVASERGFPEPSDANEPITAITYKTRDRFIVLGCGDFVNTRSDVLYLKCADEIDLIKRFVDIWTGDYPDIVTGWNVKFFDIPYIINRITRLLGEKVAKRLSPWNYLGERSAFIMGREQKSYAPSGIAILDYIDLYKKFAAGGQSQESYKLNAIAHAELGETKLSFAEYGDLHTLYKKNYQKFIEYNIRDVELVGFMDDKLKLIDLALTLAYNSKTNFDDVFSQVRMWDALIFNHLKKKNIIIPPMKSNSKEVYPGAHVKSPILGMHKYVVSIDLDSLYPHLIQQFNISPEMLIEPEDYVDAHRAILLEGVSVDAMLECKIDTSKLKELNCTITPNGQFFRTDQQGFLAEMMESLYANRKKYKNLAIQAKKEVINAKPEEKEEVEKRIARFNNLQMALKVSLNSAYGALGNEYFRFFDVRQAAAITTAGQLSIRWIELKLNQYMNKLLKTEVVDYVIASDTDSIYLNLETMVNQSYFTIPEAERKIDVITFIDKVFEKRIQPFIDKSYQELADYTNAFAQRMRMKREVIADKGIWTSKKRYILNVHDNEGVRYKEPQIKIMGSEAIRSSTPSACRTKIKEAIKIIMTQDEEAVIKFVAAFRQEFKTLEPSLIAFPRGVNVVSKYKTEDAHLYTKGTPIHARGSLVYNHQVTKLGLKKEYPQIRDRDKIFFIYLKEPNPVHSNIISFPNSIPREFDIEGYIDYNTQFEKSFLEPIKLVLDVIGWKAEKTRNILSLYRKSA